MEGSPGVENKEAGDIKMSAEDVKRAGIQVVELQPRSEADVVTVTATVKPNQDLLARIAPRVEGRILRVDANLGDSVRAGQPLATLDSVTLGEAQSNLLQVQATNRVAQADFQRAQSLAAEEIIPQRELLRAKAELEKSNAELRGAQDKLRLLGASASTGTEGTFLLRAPFAGTVVQRKATLGELATPSETAFTIADLSRVWIEANITEDLLSRVRSGAVATVTVAAYPGVIFTGKVTYIGRLLTPETRTVAARIEVNNKDGRLKPEMFATANIEVGQMTSNVLSVPDAAVVLLQGQPTVFVAEGDGFEPRPVETGDKLGGRTVIRSGVQAGDQIVIAGAYALKARLLKSQISDEH
ncbi:efflux RND transporter periplasmic adaptor subunit [Roseateles saccharophilus]|uniref:Cobalt-zinc-cadmium efflux system membrane fusion protein n=3 Tax=Roseateles saccharophilus TaxID=304 RepID=A0A4R3UV88_ROSSA|nr:cobalt-zinc-cadmium efflux system membrane fusion protein [Roseateles saccharophilus]